MHSPAISSNQKHLCQQKGLASTMPRQSDRKVAKATSTCHFADIGVDVVLLRRPGVVVVDQSPRDDTADRHPCEAREEGQANEQVIVSIYLIEYGRDSDLKGVLHTA